jgi:hypothetical protein
MATLATGPVLAALDAAVAHRLFWQATDPAHPYYGAWIDPTTGIDDAGHVGTASLLTACCYLILAREETVAAKHAAIPADELLQRAHLMIDYILRARRPSGLIDLRSTNYDSSPDTGFAVQQLATALELARERGRQDAEWTALAAKIERFIRDAAAGMRIGGFHTPNHRWVIASALAQAVALFPDLDVRETIAAYVAEGFDVDAEGAFIERSAAIYDAVNDRSLLLLADHWDDPETRARAYAAVRANLTLDLALLNADGTVETALSHRQDYGTRVVPLNLATSYLHCGLVENDPRFLRAAQMLWDAASAPSRDVLWLAYVMLRFNPVLPDPATLPALPDRFVHAFPKNGLWRVRDGLLSASFFRGTPRLCTLLFGQAEIRAIRISQTYFGVGLFVADELAMDGEGAVLHSEGRADPRRPAYEQPLGRPVPPEQWETLRRERDLYWLPPCTSELAVTHVDGGFDLHYRTLDGLDDVTAEIAIDFAPGGIWETEDTAFRPQAGQVLFLKRGAGTMRYGKDAITISPGSGAHRIWQMRHTTPAPDCVRVLLTFLTPADHHFTIQGYEGLTSL